MKVEVLEPHLVEQNDFLRRFLDASGPARTTSPSRSATSARPAEAEAAGPPPSASTSGTPQWQEAFLHPKEARGVRGAAGAVGGHWEPTAGTCRRAPRGPRARPRHPRRRSSRQAPPCSATSWGGRSRGASSTAARTSTSLAGRRAGPLVAPAGDAALPWTAWLEGRRSGAPPGLHRASPRGARRHPAETGTGSCRPERNLGVRLVLRAPEGNAGTPAVAPHGRRRLLLGPDVPVGVDHVPGMVEVQEQRSLDVGLAFISLAGRQRGEDYDKDFPPRYPRCHGPRAEAAAGSRPAVREQHGPRPARALYTALGNRFHVERTGRASCRSTPFGQCSRRSTSRRAGSLSAMDGAGASTRRCGPTPRTAPSGRARTSARRSSVRPADGPSSFGPRHQPHPPGSGGARPVGRHRANRQVPWLRRAQALAARATAGGLIAPPQVA
jgi:hypothetical protein